MEMTYEIGMDNKGSGRDNLFIAQLRRSAKYEEVYLHARDTVSGSPAGIGRDLNPHNPRRPHSSSKKPDQVYFSQ